MSFYCGCGRLHDVKFDDYTCTKIIECLCGAIFRATKETKVTIETITPKEAKIIYDAKR